MDSSRLVRVKITNLMPHEMTSDEHTAEIVESMRTDGLLLRPIAAHKVNARGRFMIIDGHHRVAALRKLGYSYAIVRVVDYLSPNIKVKSWNGGPDEWDKVQIIKDAIEHRLKAPQTTKHVILLDGVEQTFHDNDIIEPIINFPIKKLK